MPNENEAPEPKKASIKTDSTVEEAVAAVAEHVTKSKSPLLPLLAVVVPLLAGGSMGLGGWTAQSEARLAYEALSKKVDKLGEDLQDTTKALAAAATRAQAERHEERIRSLEDKDRDRDRVMDRLSMEVEALKKAPK